MHTWDRFLGASADCPAAVTCWTCMMLAPSGDSGFPFPTWVSVCCSPWHSVFCSRHFLFCVCQLPPTRVGSCTWVSSCLMERSCQWTVPPGAMPRQAFQELLASGFHLLDGWSWRSRSFSTKYIGTVLLFPATLPTSCHSRQSWRWSEVKACK